MDFIYIILLLLALELAVFQGIAVWRMLGGGNRGKESSRAVSEERETAEERKNREIEKAWQEGMSAMMRYDLSAARKAVRDDTDESR